ncbi:MAG: ABC transporter ATP-binding protein, partial [Chloroflexi bacterium]
MGRMPTRRQYEATRALSDLNLTVEQGEIFGYLGPNGAGKTTTIRLLLDLIRPTAGRAFIFDMDANAQSVEVHKRIGFLPGELNLWKNRTARQVVNYFAQVRAGANAGPILRYADELAERLDFNMNKPVRDYSSGNKRKLGLILALMHKPDLLILDEPTSGLDPLMQQTFNQLMLEVKEEGRTVFMSSHVLSEVQAICDRVGILRHGELKA